MAPANGFAESEPTAPPDRSAERATRDFVALSARYQAAGASTRTQLLGDLISAAAARQQLLTALVEHDPGTVLRVALPSRLVAGLPAEVQAQIEKEVQLEGVLEVLHEDRVDGNHRYLYALATATERLAMYFATDPPKLLTGTRVRVRGIRVGGALALDGNSTSVTTLSLAIEPNTFGEQRTLLVLVAFSDTATLPYSVEYARSVVFDTTDQFFLEASFQQTWITGDVAGWFTIALASPGCDLSALTSQAQAAVTAAGFDLAAYQRHVYAFPANSACGWWGVGTVGGNPSQAWINGNLVLLATAHEMGHNVGLYHSHALDCGATVLGPPCSSLEYGDYVDTMGNWNAGQYNAFHKERIGWLGYGVSPPITTVVASGTYTLEAYELSGNRPKALKILKATDPTTGKKTWYYVEYRQAIGVDGFLASNSNVRNGVLIRTGSETSPNSSYLLDLTPATSAWSDPALLVGQSFSDPTAGVTITTAWTTATEAAVTVTFGTAACAPANPSVALSPPESTWVAPGTTVTYNVSVVNNDSAACAPSSFALQASAPSGWTAVLASPSLTLNPGASGPTTLQITSPSATADGFYTVGVSATNSGAPSYVGSASASYIVVLPPPPSLGVEVWTNQSTYARKQTVSITALVTMGGLPLANATVAFVITKPNEKVVTRTATTSATGTAVFTMRIGPRDPVGVYTIRADASAEGNLTATATTSFTVE